MYLFSSHALARVLDATSSQLGSEKTNVVTAPWEPGSGTHTQSLDEGACNRTNQPPESRMAPHGTGTPLRL